MTISLFDMLKIGIGPSSSHTVGPMRAALRFVQQLQTENLLAQTQRVCCHLYGSLGATGVGHGTGSAVLMGLEGEDPETINPENVVPRVDMINQQNILNLAGKKHIPFLETKDLLYLPFDSLPQHPNAMRLIAYSANETILLNRVYFSVGGGFVLDDEEILQTSSVGDQVEVPYPYSSSAELLALCKEHGLRIYELMYENEKVFRTEQEIRMGILKFWRVMQECVQNGISHEGILPGGLQLKRRAAELYRKLTNESGKKQQGNMMAMDWVNLYAMAVNEENASGGRIVTAPTNGAAGIIPAVLHYYMNFFEEADQESVIRFLLTASAIGVLIKMNASISGAEVGCQGEVGSACAMAAAGLAEVLGGTPEQVENAAEIGIEHNLGLTCDPIGGLVQVPCIERNAMAAIKAINAAFMALRGDGEHLVSLDSAILTMRETGKDMMDKYKETSRGGLAVNVKYKEASQHVLAVNVIEC